MSALASASTNYEDKSEVKFKKKRIQNFLKECCLKKKELDWLDKFVVLITGIVVVVVILIIMFVVENLDETAVLACVVVVVVVVAFVVLDVVVVIVVILRSASCR